MRNRGLSAEDKRRLKEILENHRRHGGRLSEMPTDDGENESWCRVCESRITESVNLGEVGHERGCTRREERYKGKRGSRQEPPAREVASD